MKVFKMLFGKEKPCIKVKSSDSVVVPAQAAWQCGAECC